MTINLTPEELRNFAYRGGPSSWRRSHLALALADAIEERDRLRARVEELERAAHKEASDGKG